MEFHRSEARRGKLVRLGWMQSEGKNPLHPSSVQLGFETEFALTPGYNHYSIVQCEFNRFKLPPFVFQSLALAR